MSNYLFNLGDESLAKVFTSIFAFVHRGISTTILNTVFESSAYKGMSCRGDTKFPVSFSVNTIKLHMKYFSKIFPKNVNNLFLNKCFDVDLAVLYTYSLYSCYLLFKSRNHKLISSLNHIERLC